MADDGDDFRRIFDHPATRAILSLAAIVGSVVVAKKQFGTPEGQKDYWDQVRQARANRRELDAKLARYSARTQAKWNYLNGPGRATFVQRALTVVGPELAFPDARFERRKGYFRGSAFRVTSASAGATLDVDWDNADRCGGLKLEREDSRRWTFVFWARGENLGEDGGARSAQDVDSARLSCRLLATPGSPFSTISFLHHDHVAIREQIWREYVELHPELADED